MHIRPVNTRHIVFIHSFILAPFGSHYYRTVYTFMDLFGDLGGVEQIIMTLASLLVGSYQSFSLEFKLIKKL